MRTAAELTMPPASMRSSCSTNGSIALASGSSCPLSGAGAAPATAGGDAIEEGACIIGKGEDRAAEGTHEAYLIS
jgi:hypothetical protein